MALVKYKCTLLLLLLFVWKQLDAWNTRSVVREGHISDICQKTECGTHCDIGMGGGGRKRGRLRSRKIDGLAEDTSMNVIQTDIQDISIPTDIDEIRTLCAGGATTGVTQFRDTPGTSLEDTSFINFEIRLICTPCAPWGKNDATSLNSSSSLKFRTTCKILLESERFGDPLH